MKIKLIYLSFLIFFIFSNFASSEVKLEISKIQEFKLKNIKTELPLGSGLSFFKANAYGITRFYSVIDKVQAKSSKVTEIPSIAILKLKRKKLNIERYISINNKRKFNLKLEELDLEGISSAPNDELWLVDEIGFRLIKVSSSTGTILEVINVKDKFSKIINKAEEGRGFEGITLMPNNKILAVIQSPLENNQIFFYLHDLNNSSKNKFLSYKIDKKKNSDIKIGGLQSVNSSSFLLLEREEFTDKENVKIKYFSLESLNETYEFSKEKIYKLKLISSLKLKKKDLSLKKIEGITLLEGSQSIALINDGDGINDVKLILIDLKESLIKWGFREYFLSLTLGLILLASVMFTYKVLKQ